MPNTKESFRYKKIRTESQLRPSRNLYPQSQQKFVARKKIPAYHSLKATVHQLENNFGSGQLFFCINCRLPKIFSCQV